MNGIAMNAASTSSSRTITSSRMRAALIIGLVRRSVGLEFAAAHRAMPPTWEART